VSHHPIERVLKGEHVRRKTIAKIVKKLSIVTHAHEIETRTAFVDQGVAGTSLKAENESALWSKINYS